MKRSLLARLGRVCYRRRRLVLAAWVVVLVAIEVLANVAGGEFATRFTLPGTETQRAFDLLEERFPSQSGDSALIVFRTDALLDDPSVRDPMSRALEAVRALPHVTRVATPYDLGGARQVARDGELAGRLAFATVQLDGLAVELGSDTGSGIQEAVREELDDADGITVEFGGDIFLAQGPPEGTELIGVAAAVLILLFTFGSLLAMGLPIVTALFGIGIGLAGIALLQNVLEVPQFAPLVAAMIGIGVGIDYALFIVTRYRQGLHDGLDPEQAVVRAVDTAGRAVLFAGITVVIALLGMFSMGLSFVAGLAVGASFGVLVTMIASLTLLPALLGFVGRNIDRLHVPVLHRAGSQSRPKFWYRWSRLIQRRPWPFFLGGTLIVVVLALPVFAIRLGFSDSGNGPETQTTRRAYDLLSAGFGPGFNGPLLVVATVPSPAAQPTIATLRARLASDPGVAQVSPPFPNASGDTVIMQVYGRYAPQDERTDRLVRHLRRDVIAPAVRGTGVVAASGGAAAIGIDIAEKMSSRLFVFFGAVIALSFVLLMVVFRSVLVPVKAAIMNVLSIGAAFGVLVAVFQLGWGSSLIGVGRTGPIEAFAPMMLFAILFGLSMDYEVFLLSRVREEFDRSKDNAQAVADGLATTARVITAAAAIMVAVFLSFVLQPDRVVKLIGLGLATAIFVDATLVRMVLVPSTMELLGNANWWLPRWLDRILPRLTVDVHGITVNRRDGTRVLAQLVGEDERGRPIALTEDGVRIAVRARADGDGRTREPVSGSR